MQNLNIRNSKTGVLQPRQRAKQRKKDVQFPKVHFSLYASKLSRKKLSLFCRQLSVMLNAGIPLLSALEILKEQDNNSKLQEAVEGVCTSLEAGLSFSEALEKYPNVFPSILITMVQAGETGGVLNNILDSVAGFLEWEHRTRQKVKAAITYPIVVLILSVLAVSFLVIFILPVFARILAQMDVELPLITRLLLRISWFIKGNLPLFLLLPPIATVIGMHWFSRSTTAREKLDTVALKVPLIGGIRRKIIVSRFCKTLSTLLRSGVPLLTALEIVEKTAGNIVIEKHVSLARKDIIEGNGMSRALKKAGIFTSVVIEMITVGEETGELAFMLEKAGEIYDEEVDNYATKIATLIEPLLICIVGAIVCVVLLSVFLPMFSVIGHVG